MESKAKAKVRMGENWRSAQVLRGNEMSTSMSIDEFPYSCDRTTPAVVLLVRCTSPQLLLLLWAQAEPPEFVMVAHYAAYAGQEWQYTVACQSTA